MKKIQLPAEREKGAALPGADLESHQTGPFKIAGQRRQNAPVGSQAVGTAVEGEQRLVIADRCRKLFQLSSLHVGRVGDNEVESEQRLGKRAPAGNRPSRNRPFVNTVPQH